MIEQYKPMIEHELNQLLNFLGRRLKHFRELRQLSQTDVHLKTGIAKSTISEIENGHCKDPKLSTIVSLAYTYEIDLSVLLMKQNLIEEENDIAQFRDAFDALNKIYNKIK